MSIPKIIHYCWFGGRSFPEEIKRYMESWETYLPEYRIIEWNEANVDVYANEFIKKAYQMKKYAFVSDYARLAALYQFGGIYFDVDIEVKKPFDDGLLENEGVFCFESSEKVMTAFMAVEKGSPFIKKFLDYYEAMIFEPEHMTPNTEILTELMKTDGFTMDGTAQTCGRIRLYPQEYFSAFDLKDFSYQITEKTYTVHHFYGSWCTKKEKFSFALKKKLRSVAGAGFYEMLKRVKKRIIG